MALPPLLLDPHAEAEPTDGFLSGPSRKALTYPDDIRMLGDRDLLWMYADGRTVQVNETTVSPNKPRSDLKFDTRVLDDGNQPLRPAIRLRPHQIKDVGSSRIDNKIIEHAKYDVYVEFGVQESYTTIVGIAYFDDKILRGVVSSLDLPVQFPPSCHRDNKPKKRCVEAMAKVMKAAAPVLNQLYAGDVPVIWKDEAKRSEGAKIWLEFVTRTLHQTFGNQAGART